MAVLIPNFSTLYVAGGKLSQCPAIKQAGYSFLEPSTGGLSRREKRLQIKYKGCLSIEGKWDNFETRLTPALQYMQQQFLAL